MGDFKVCLQLMIFSHWLTFIMAVFSSRFSPSQKLSFPRVCCIIVALLFNVYSFESIKIISLCDDSVLARVQLNEYFF